MTDKAELRPNGVCYYLNSPATAVGAHGVHIYYQTTFNDEKGAELSEIKVVHSQGQNRHFMIMEARQRLLLMDIQDGYLIGLCRIHYKDQHSCATDLVFVFDIEKDNKIAHIEYHQALITSDRVTLAVGRSQLFLLDGRWRHVTMYDFHGVGRQRMFLRGTRIQSSGIHLRSSKKDDLVFVEAERTFHAIHFPSGNTLWQISMPCATLFKCFNELVYYNLENTREIHVLNIDTGALSPILYKLSLIDLIMI